jgi:hypothetical protein
MTQNRGRTASDKYSGNTANRIFIKELFGFGKQGFHKKFGPDIIRLKGNGIKIAVIALACAKRDMNVKRRFHKKEPGIKCGRCG